MKPKSGFLTRRILQHACTVKQEERAGRGALIQQQQEQTQGSGGVLADLRGCQVHTRKGQSAGKGRVFARK